MLALYMSGKEIVNYCDNNDVSTLTYKEFETTDLDKYPTFTICFLPKIGYSIFNRTKASEAFGSSAASDFRKLLEGYSWDDTGINGSILIQMDAKGLMDINQNNIFRAALASSVAGNTHKSSKDEEKFNNFLLDLSYQDTTQVCFSRKAFFHGSFTRKRDVLSFDMPKLYDLFTTSYIGVYGGEIRIYLHYPGQMLQNFGKEAHKIKIAQLEDVTRLGKERVMGLNIDFVI